MAWNAASPLERLNLPDTLKAQYTAKLTRGHVLMSDMGRVLLSITADSVGWHDPLGGHGNAEDVRQQVRRALLSGGPQRLVPQRTRQLSRRDGQTRPRARATSPPMSISSRRVDAGDDGALTFHAGNSKAGDSVDLRAEMDVLVVLTTCQHPLDPNPHYDAKAGQPQFLIAPPPGAGRLLPQLPRREPARLRADRSLLRLT